MHFFMNGVIATLSFVIALLFARFYRDSKDRFFGHFAAAFLLFGLERFAIYFSGGASETHPSIYLVRCVAFLVIIFAVVDKNRSK